MKTPHNKISFQVSPEMTRLDVKNYLEKIYNVKVLDVHTKIMSGRTFISPFGAQLKEPSRELLKEDDIKYAFVTFVRIIFFFFYCNMSSS